MIAATRAAGFDALLGAVRQRLWRGHALAAIRLSLWGTASLLLLAALAHVAKGSISVTGLWTAILLLWGVAAARAVTQRPGSVECAAWADRHLGGESAYSTWLESRGAAGRDRDEPALQWLEQWMEAAAPRSLRLLAERREGTSLARPLATVLICAAVAAVVLEVPVSGPRGDAQPLARSDVSPRRAGDSAPLDATTLDDTALARELADALHSTGRAPEAGPRGPEASSGPPGSEYDGDRGSGASVQENAARNVAGSAVTSVAAHDAGTAGSGRAATGSGDGSGREAGDSRDDRRDGGTSRVPPPGAASMRRDAGGQPLATGRQADMDRQATFDETLAGNAPAPTTGRLVALAATPPPAAAATRLTPAQAAYVQAWRAASEDRP